MSFARVSLCLAGSALLSVACLADEAAPSATAVPVQPTIFRPPLVTPATVSAVPSPSPSVRVDTYTVQTGDSLSSIAAKLYRDASAWETIYDANRDVLKTPDDLEVGQTLRIPPAPTPGPTSAVVQAAVTSIPATRIPATSVPATSATANGVPATSAAAEAPATEAPTAAVQSTAAPATAAPVTSAPATSAPTSFVPATGPTVIALTAAANPTGAPTRTTPPTPV